MTSESGEIDERDERDERETKTIRWRSQRLSYIAGQREEKGCTRPCCVPVQATAAVTSHRTAKRRE